MGLAHDGKKIIGLTHNGKKILGIAHAGSIIWQYLVATKLWTSATDSNLITNLQLDDKGLLYMIDTQSINRIGKNDGTIYATRIDSGGICGDLTFNTVLNSFSHVSKTDYWNKNNYSDLTVVYDGKGTVAPVDVTYSNYQLSNYNVTLVTYPNGYVDTINNSYTSNGYPIDHATNTSLGTFYLQALDGFGSNSNFTAGDFLAYSSTGAKAYNASSSTALDLEGTQSNGLESSAKVSYAPIGYDSNKVNYYLFNEANLYILFSATKSNSIVNLTHLTYSSPVNTDGTIEDLVIDYDAYNNLMSNVTKSTDGSNSSASLVDVPSKFTSYSSEKDSNGNSHIYALKYNANSDWTQINKEKLVDLDAGWNVKKMVKNDNVLFVGENNHTKNQSRVEAIQIDKVMAPSLSSAFNLTTKDSSSNTYQPNSIAVSASNFGVASNATSASKTLLRSMCIDNTIYTDQSNTTGAQGVCGVPYDNTGAFINENGKLSYRDYSHFGTLLQYYSNSAIKGADPMVGYISSDLKNSTAIDWASNGNLYIQNSTGWNGNYTSGYTDNTGDIAMAPIKGVVNAYLIHPSTGDIKVFDTNSLSVTKTLPQYHLTNVTNGTSDVIAVSVDGTICYGTKNKDAQVFFFENPNTGILFKSIAFNSGYYLLDIASDGNNNFAVLYYNSTSKQVAIDWYTAKGSFITATMFSATYTSLPYGKIEIDPQNGNVGLIMGNNYSMWTL